jgi:hypothetical protein
MATLRPHSSRHAMYIFFEEVELIVGCYPFQDRDPFMLDETPHIFFAGNQPEYASDLVHGILLNISD